MRLLECFSSAGGASVGYARAGFEVVGVDIAPQPHYPFEFHQADAIEFLKEHGHEFDAIAGSPPCHDHSRLRSITGVNGTASLLPDFREACQASGRPYVIENVETADMPGALVLCGSEFGLGCWDGERWRTLRRHRKFESNVWLWGAGGCACSGRPVVGVYGGGSTRPSDTRRGGWTGNKSQASQALGIDWMNRTELAQAIPPAYTEFLGGQLLAYLEACGE